ncbi:MAG TPA: heme o synthase [Candidatus Paceibacterota bacterium]|nr:heme o synthase [Candidatus Paceibacterota bacterium]
MKYYYELTKSGLVFGNLITVIAGFLLGARTVAIVNGILPVDPWLLFATCAGIACVMASGCVFNNYIDRDIDGKMERTRHRALVARHISGRAAIVFAAALGIAGFFILAIYTNTLATLAAATGFIFYVFAYSLWGKRRTVYGTFIGAIAGATPPVVGYAAASGRVDMAAAILFVIMLAWQMPHFFAIAIRRRDDYAAAHIPVMPVSRGMRRTKSSMAIYIIEFTLAACLLFMFGYAGIPYLAIAAALGIVWLGFAVRGFSIPDAATEPSHPHAAANKKWATQMFALSLIIMVALFGAIAVTAVI